ncbi:MAG: hypothetical protein D6738_05655 [Acidobacteria bacterium]|nr:MAG: hypothetical protein D6738_05655 [Acidobacteriota bacterium]
MSPHRATEARRRAILALVARRRIRTQDELVEALADQGFEVSQASVSRDIAALGLGKRDGHWVLPQDGAADEDPLLARIRGRVLAVRESPPNLLVLVTPPGEASAAALAIDRLGIADVAGTIAGDDTIFVATAAGRDLRRLARRLRRLAAGRP